MTSWPASLGDHLLVQLEYDRRRRRRRPATSIDQRHVGTGVGRRGGPSSNGDLAAFGRTVLILGIETATEQVSVAIGGHEGVLGLFEVCRGRRHAETLIPAIEFVCAQADIELTEIGVVAVDVGPGLFTGMRVGLAAAKAIAQALRVPMIGISSLDLLALPAAAQRPRRRRGDRRSQGRAVLRAVPAGARRRAAGRRAALRVASTTSSAT